ncbi:MAG: IS6 family transposase [Proteobacteria bacterium]|nr:IS6 family transposase [Pseudomonadota bacterium]
MPEQKWSAEALVLDFQGTFRFWCIGGRSRSASMHSRVVHMPKAQERDPIYRQRRFPAEVIETCVRWYITYRLSYRDMVAMMAERGVTVSHTTIMRWVLRYLPEYEARWDRYAKPVHGSWRMDETAVRVRGGNHYLYRAVDKHGKSVDSVLCAGRDRAAAQLFFEHAAGRPECGWPEKINVDGYTATHLALRNLGKKDRRWRSVEVRSNRYLNNIVEQDHRAIKRRCASMLGLKSFRSAAITLAGIELAHRIRKQQFSLPSDARHQPGSLKDLWDLALRTDGAIPYPMLEGLAQAANAPELKQRIRQPAARRELLDQRPRRYSRKVTAGHGLYLLIAPGGGKYWRYNYTFGGKRKTLALGVYPDVPAALAKKRHQQARSQLARGMDPMASKRNLRLQPAA